MTELQLEALSDCGFDLEEARGRFLNNDALLEKFLKKFVNDDSSYGDLRAAMEQGDAAAAFAAAHTLKGVSGNLALHGLYERTCKLVETLRGKEDMAAATEAGAQVAFAAVCDAYDRTAQALEQLN